MSDNSTASPMIGPDGDVYFGVLESPSARTTTAAGCCTSPATLRRSKTPGAFGWDITPSVVPRAMVPSLTRARPRYSDFHQVQPLCRHRRRRRREQARRARPRTTSMVDPVSGATVMKEVLTIAGVTPDEGPSADISQRGARVVHQHRRVDPATGSVLVNSEDGICIAGTWRPTRSARRSR